MMNSLAQALVHRRDRWSATSQGNYCGIQGHALGLGRMRDRNKVSVKLGVILCSWLEPNDRFKF